MSKTDGSPRILPHRKQCFLCGKKFICRTCYRLFSELELPFSVDTFQHVIKKSPQWKNIIVAGPVHWFTGKILLPPCQHLHIIKPSWLSSDVVFPKPFAESEYYIESTTSLVQPVVAHHQVHIEVKPSTILTEVIEENDILFLESVSRISSPHDQHIREETYQPMAYTLPMKQ